jgi:putative protein kinase ArgK-like GTPase of G3E family
MPKKSKSFDQNKKYEQAYKVNAIRRKVMKDLFHQIKEYFNLNYQQLIERVEKLYQTEVKTRKFLSKKTTNREARIKDTMSSRSSHLEGYDNHKSGGKIQHKIQLKHYLRMINELKKLWGMND